MKEHIYCRAKPGERTRLKFSDDGLLAVMALCDIGGALVIVFLIQHSNNNIDRI